MENIAKIFKSLSDKTRIRILHLLLKAKRELCICEIMDSLRLAQYNISKHVKELKLAGFIKERKEGRFVFYSAISQKDKFFKQLTDSITSIPGKYFLSDNKRLKKRLCLRKHGKIIVGMVNPVRESSLIRHRRLDGGIIPQSNRKILCRRRKSADFSNGVKRKCSK